ncbi:MAG: M20/M25/M40 family metallo-hydrolase [Nitrososphaeria archaeon]
MLECGRGAGEANDEKVGGPARRRAVIGLMANRPLRERLEEVARSHGIPYQLEVLQGGTTDASAIALTKEGIPAAVVSVPTRYVHSPSEVLRLSDLEGVAKLLALFTEEVSPDWLAGLSTSRVK